MREVRLNDAEGARATLARALEADGTNPAALAALEPIHLRARAWIDYARVLVAQGDQVGDPAAARECYERAGDVLWECARDGASAAACYERAAAMAPREVSPLEKLAAVLEGTGRYGDLPRVYERALQVLRDPAQQAAVLYRLGTLHETRLERPDEAKRAYRRALEAAPTFGAAAQALAALHRALGEHAEYVALELNEVERIAQDAPRAARLAALGEVCETALAQPDDAVALYERAVALDPGAIGAFDALDRIYRARGQWPALIALHEKLLARAKDPRRVRATRLALAALYHDRAGEPARAAELLQKTLGGEQDDLPTLVALARAYADAGRWAEYVEVLEAQAKLLRDDAELVATLYRIGAAIETRLDDPRRALAAYARVLDRAPRHEGALRALSRIHRAQARWEDVIAAERRLLDLAPRPDDAAAVLYGIARLAEERLGRPADAIRACEEALARVPGHPPSLALLERLLRATNRYEALAAVSERQAEAAREPTHKARLLCQAAAVYELHLRDPARAAALYDRALAAVPGLDAALWGLARLQEVRGEWQALEKTLQSLLEKTTHSGARLRLLVRLARTYEWRLGAPSRAAALYEEALAGGVQGAALAVDRLRVARIEGRREVAARWLEHVANATRDARVALALLRQRALMAEYGGAAPAEAAEAYVAALAHAPGDVQAVEGFIRNAARAGNDPRLPQALAAHGRLLSDAPSRALVLYIAGATAEHAGHDAEAATLYAESLEAAPGFLPALEGQRRLHEAAGDHAGLAAVCGRIGETASHPENVVDAHLAAGEAHADHLAAPREALTHFRAVLAVQPGHARAFARAAHLLEAAGDWAGFVELSGTQRVRDYDRARAILEEVVRGDPADRVAATRFAEVSALAGDPARARDLYQLLSQSGATLERVRAMLALAEVQRTSLGDLPGAHAAAGEAFALATGDAAVVPLLDEHYARTEDWGAYATLGDEALARAAANAPGALALHMALARVYRERLRVSDRADQHLRAAIEAFPAATEPRLALAFGLLGGNDHAAYRGLLAVCMRIGLHGAAALMASAIVLLGEGGGQVEGALALAVAPQPIAGALPPDDALHVLVGPTRARFFRRVLGVVDPHLHEIFPAGHESLAGFTRIPDAYPAATRARAVGAALGVTALHLVRGAGRDAAVLMSEPRALVLGPEHLTDAGTARLLFDAAHGCARIAAGSTLGLVLPHEQVLAVLEVATDPDADAPGYRELRKRVSSALPRRARKEIERILEEGGGDLRREWGPWEEEERKRALRAGVVFCRDLRIVAQVFAPEVLAIAAPEERRRRIAASAPLVDALRFAASEACWATHRRVYGQP
jgi:tetratricopeptide (TPR) repeat protein